MDERNQCFFDQCAANSDETLEEPSVRRFMAGPATMPGWYWFCEECAEQMDAEAEEAKRQGDYYAWNGGFDHTTGEKLEFQP